MRQRPIGISIDRTQYNSFLRWASSVLGCDPTSCGLLGLRLYGSATQAPSDFYAPFRPVVFAAIESFPRSLFSSEKQRLWWPPKSWRGQRQRHRRPAGGGGGDELRPAVREAARRILDDREAACGHEPRAVR